jgi:hypothetical protein
MPEPKRFNIDTDEAKHCRRRLAEISAIGGDQQTHLEQLGEEGLTKLVALTIEMAEIRGRQQAHALRAAAEMQVILNKQTH